MFRTVRESFWVTLVAQGPDLNTRGTFKVALCGRATKIIREVVQNRQQMKKTFGNYWSS